jgi:tetratricopeptide (TPR) repeat protein
MLALEFTKIITTIDKVVNIIQISKISDLKKDLSSYEEKHLQLIDKYFQETKNETENGNKTEFLKELKKLNPISNSFFKKYYRSLVRANANLENLVLAMNKEEADLIQMDKILNNSKNIEDYMFNIEDNDESSIKNLAPLKTLLEEHSVLNSNLLISKDVYSSLSIVKKLPESYKDFEITFYTPDEGIEGFSSRVLSLKLLYEVMLRLNNHSENNENRLIILKAEKENNEYYKIAGINSLISDIYFIIKEWIKEFIGSNSSEEKEVLKLNNMQNLEVKIKGLIDKNQIPAATGEKYLDVIKKSLKNLQVEKCTSIELYAENINISSGRKITSAVQPEVREAITAKPEPKTPQTYNEKMAANKESETLKKIETSILLKSSIPPGDVSSAEALLQKGITMMSIKRYKEAMDFFDKAIEQKVNFAEAYNYKANAYIQSSLFAEAIKLTDQAIALKPDYKDAYLNKGTALFSINKHQDALNMYKKTIEIDPQYAEGYFNLGSCYMMLNDGKKNAIEAFSRAIQISPKYAAAYYNRACAYVSEKEIDNCLKDLNIAIKLDRNFKNMLKFDSDFSTILEDANFKSLIS